jgi:hypothetical protein
MTTAVRERHLARLELKNGYSGREAAASSVAYQAAVVQHNRYVTHAMQTCLADFVLRASFQHLNCRNSNRLDPHHIL